MLDVQGLLLSCLIGLLCIFFFLSIYDRKSFIACNGPIDQFSLPALQRFSLLVFLMLESQILEKVHSLFELDNTLGCHYLKLSIELSIHSYLKTH